MMKALTVVIGILAVPIGCILVALAAFGLQRAFAGSPASPMAIGVGAALLLIEVVMFVWTLRMVVASTHRRLSPWSRPVAVFSATLAGVLMLVLWPLVDFYLLGRWIGRRLLTQPLVTSP